jgi:PAS domain S-box-containing protein
VVTPFLRTGLERGEKAIYIVDAHTAETILGYLHSDGLDVGPYLARGQFVVLTSDETYMREGAFDPAGMIALLRSETEQALAEGYPALRVTGEMTWALRGLTGSERLIEYEARLNEFFPGSQCLAICQYDRRRFAPDILLNVLRTHPIAVVGTEIHDNFYYIPPAELLGGDLSAAELRYWLQNLAGYKQVEEALRKSEKKYRQLVETLREGVWVIDQDAYTTYVNPSMAAMLGYTADEMVGRHLFSFMDECGVEIAKHNLERRRQGIQEQHDFEFLRKDGTRVYASLETSPITDDDGNYVGAVAGVQDITERRRTQIALRRYANRLATLYEIDRAILDARSVEGIAEVSLHYIRQVVPSVRASVVTFDFEAAEMLRLAAHTDSETRLGKGWRGPLEWVWFIEELRRGQVYTVEDIQAQPPASPLMEMLQVEGVRAYASMPLMAQGELIGSLNLGMDHPGSLTSEQADIVREMANQLAIALHQAYLHEQVQRYAEELEQRVAERTAALQASEARFRAIFEGAGIGIALVDEDGRLVESNPALQAMLGYAAEELRGMAFTALAHPDDATADMDQLGELMAGKRDEYKVEMRYFRKDRQLRWANVTVSPVCNAGERPRFAIGMVEDITEQKQAQAALIQAEKLAIAGKLAASLAHEINNPLQSVIGCLGLAEETLAEGGEISQYLRVAHEELRRAARIVTQLRDLHQRSRPEEREPADVNGLLEQVLVLSRRQCENYGVEVVWSAAADLPPLLLVPDQMRQVFLNLLLNAIDAMPRGGRLQVSTTRTGQPAGVCIAFTDSGVGVAPDALPHIFDPFYSTKPDGLGLGLFVSQDIVKQHGGHIEVNSQVGVGTTCTVWLPASQAMASL